MYNVENGKATITNKDIILMDDEKRKKLIEALSNPDKITKENIYDDVVTIYVTDTEFHYTDMSHSDLSGLADDLNDDGYLDRFIDPYRLNNDIDTLSIPEDTTSYTALQFKNALEHLSNSYYQLDTTKTNMILDLAEEI